MSATFVVLAALLHPRQVQEVKPCVILAPSTVLIDSARLSEAQRSEELWNEALRAQGLSELSSGAVRFLAHRDVYDPGVFQAKKKLWDQIGNGALKEGDLLPLKEYKGAVTNYKGHLRDEYGFDLDSTSSEEVSLTFVRRVTLVNRQGEKIRVTLSNAENIDIKALPVYEKNTAKDSAQDRLSHDHQSSPGSLGISDFGFRLSDPARLRAMGDIFYLLEQRLAQEYDSELDAVDAYEAFLRDRHPGIASGSTTLTNAELEQVKEALLTRQGDWREFKVDQSETFPALRLHFRGGEENGSAFYNIAHLFLEKPKPRKSDIRPMRNI